MEALIVLLPTKCAMYSPGLFLDRTLVGNSHASSDRSLIDVAAYHAETIIWAFCVVIREF
jgi:hypothetical protein